MSVEDKIPLDVYGDDVEFSKVFSNVKIAEALYKKRDYDTALKKFAEAKETAMKLWFMGEERSGYALETITILEETVKQMKAFDIVSKKQRYKN